MECVQVFSVFVTVLFLSTSSLHLIQSTSAVIHASRPRSRAPSFTIPRRRGGTPGNDIDRTSPPSEVNFTDIFDSARLDQGLQAKLFTVSSLGLAVELGLGSSSQRLNFTLAINAELSWVQCTPCTNCSDLIDPSFQPPLYQSSSSTSFSKLPCNSGMCPISSNEILSSCSDQGTCKYNTTYNSRMSSAGDLSKDVVSMSSLVAKTTKINVTLGCGQDVGGILQFHGTSGILGFDRNNNSFIAQLKGKYQGRFVYCLPYEESLSGNIVVGNYVLSGRFSYTPMLTNPLTSNYYVGMTSISVSGTKLAIPQSAFNFNSDGVGGTVIDTTVAFTYLTNDSYGPFIQAVEKAISTLKLPRVMNNIYAAGLGFSLCYNISASAEYPSVPSVSFQFLDGTELKLGVNQTWVDVDSDNVSQTVCIAIGRSEEAGLGRLNVIGTYQQLDTAVMYDLERSRIGFGPPGCNVSMQFLNGKVIPNSASPEKKMLQVPVLLSFVICSLFFF